MISDNIDKLDTIENKLQMVADKSDEEVKKIDNDGLNVQTLKDIIKVVDEVHSLVADITDNYDSEIVPGVEKSINSTRKVLDDSLSIIDEGRNTLPEVEKLLSVSQDATNLTNDELTSLKSKLPDAKNKIHELSDKIKDMDEEDKIDELLDMMTSNWENQSDFVASPVEIEDNRLFPWPNYGTATTPFYTVLCLWVGGLLASALLSLEAPKFDDGTRIKPYEMYLGKLLLFLTVGVCQALVASIGSLIMLKVYAVHPIMYIFYSIFVSIIFVIVIYTAASILDDVGKAAIVIILVLQMAGASGNFPIEVAPVFFQKLFPFLPFTYAISGMRQIMAGIVYSILIKDIAVLSIYMFVSLIAGILLKGFMNSITNNFMEKLKKSGILRH